MKTTFYKNLKAFTLCAGFFSLVACKEKSTIRPDLIPAVDSINTFEVNNLNLSATVSSFDSMWTNDYSYPLVGIGGLTDDAFFGKTASGAYVQFVPPSEGFTFPTGTIIDSTVLSLPYIKFSYGDTSTTNLAHVIHLKAYRITDAFAIGDGTRRFYSFDKLNYNTTPLASGDITVKSLNDTFGLASGDTVNTLLRLKMGDAMDNIMQTISSDNLASATAFTDFFRGLYIAPDTTQSQNTVAYFALTGGSAQLNYAAAQIEVYYHTASSTTLQKSFFKFNPLTCSFFNSISRNYNNFPARQYVGNQVAVRDSIVVQGYPGFRTDVTIKLDNKIPSSVINKASLTVTVLKTGDEARFSAPARLLVKAVDADGTERVVSDMANPDGSVSTSGQLFVGGSPSTVLIGAQQYTQYTFNFPRELQDALNKGKTELKLRLAASITYPGAFRMLAAGPGATDGTQLRLNVIYTKLNQ